MSGPGLKSRLPPSPAEGAAGWPGSPGQRVLRSSSENLLWRRCDGGRTNPCSLQFSSRAPHRHTALIEGVPSQGGNWGHLNPGQLPPAVSDGHRLESTRWGPRLLPSRPRWPPPRCLSGPTQTGLLLAGGTVAMGLLGGTGRGINLRQAVTLNSLLRTLEHAQPHCDSGIHPGCLST